MRFNKNAALLLAFITGAALMPSSAAWADSAEWQDLRATYTRDDSSQYSNGVLRLLDLGNDCVLFDVSLMSGSEKENTAIEAEYSGVMLVDDNGIATYKDDSDKVVITMKKNGDKITVEQEGELLISTAGKYSFLEGSVSVEEQSAAELVKHLPSMATGLNTRIGKYETKFEDQLIDDWFYAINSYDVEHGNQLISTCYVANDLSCVYRMDAEDGPVLIFGSADNMLNATVLRYEETEDENAEELEAYDAAVTRVDIPEFMTVGSSQNCEVVIPANLPHNLKLTSSNPACVAVEGGKLVAKGVGQAKISAELEVSGATRTYTAEIVVAK